MGNWQPVPVVGPSYADDTRPYSSQDCINYIPEAADVQGGRSASILRGLPGLTLLGSMGSGPIRGAHNVEGQLFVVSGSELRQVAINNTSTVIGTIPGSGRVGMEHNQQDGGSELAIGNGPSGYVYSTVTKTFQQITDAAFPGTYGFVYADFYLAGVDPLGRYWFHSNLAAATDYSSLDRYEAEGAPDKILSLIANHGEIWVLGERTIEPFYDTGATQGTWARVQGAVLQIGVASKWCAASLDNTVWFFGNDGIFYKAEGYVPVRISTHAIEQAVRGLDWSQCYAQTWTDGGHKVIYWTFPDGHTWGFDVATGAFHRRESYRLNRWMASTLTWWNGMWVVGDSRNGNLYKLDWDNYTENGQPLIAERTTGVSSNAQNTTTCAGVELVMDTGRGSINADHAVEICYSNDGGYNYTKWRAKSLGGHGAYGKRIRFWKLGAFVNRVWRARVASPCKRDIIAASMKMDGTES